MQNFRPVFFRYIKTMGYHSKGNTCTKNCPFQKVDKTFIYFVVQAQGKEHAFCNFIYFSQLEKGLLHELNKHF